MMLDWSKFCAACRERGLPAPSRATWARWCRTGRLKSAVRYGGVWLVPQTAIDEFVRDGTAAASVAAC